MAACFRYIVNDVSAAIDFYTKHLGFKVEIHPAPPFAEISRGDMHIYLTQPVGIGGGAGQYRAGFRREAERLDCRQGRLDAIGRDP